MCKHAMVVAPRQRYFSKDGVEVTIQGFLHAEGVSEEKILRFEHEVYEGRKVERPLPWIEIRRVVKVASYEGLCNQVAQLGLDIREYFTPEAITYH